MRGFPLIVNAKFRRVSPYIRWFCSVDGWEDGLTLTQKRARNHLLVNRWIVYPDVQMQGGKTFELANISNMFGSLGPSAAFDVESNIMN